VSLNNFTNAISLTNSLTLTSYDLTEDGIISGNQLILKQFSSGVISIESLKKSGRYTMQNLGSPVSLFYSTKGRIRMG
jgi:hypothetical protein